MQLGVEFSVRATDAPELAEGDPEEVALENARRKAVVAASDDPDGVVLGVDTVVCIGAEMYDKPGDMDAARGTLEALSGRAHTVISGICLIQAGSARAASARTRVEFRELEDGMLEWYLASGEWRERAGGYAIQGRGAALVRRIEGDYLNVVGLPVATLLEMAPWLLNPQGG